MTCSKTFDWDNAGPLPEAWQALQHAKDSDFPETYSGTAWRAAWRLLQVAKEQPERFSAWDGWTSDNLAREATRDLDLTGFMFGWAINALRSMMEMEPVADGARVVLGERGGVKLKPTGSANEELQHALGGMS